MAKTSFDTMNKMATLVKNRRPAFTNGKGVGMLTYLMHNKAAGNPTKSDFPDPDQPPKESFIDSSHPEALKKAMAVLGLRSDQNHDGLDIDIDTAKKLYFGKEKLSEIEEAEFRALMLHGDEKFDKKRMRQFVNHDGSTTYELINPDKSVMTRFTFGQFKERKVFAQGGYDSYSKELRKLLDNADQDTQAMVEFDDLRARMQMNHKERERRFGGEEVQNKGSQDVE
jgi:hypothetical protein